MGYIHPSLDFAYFNLLTQAKFYTGAEQNFHEIVKYKIRQICI